MRLPVLSAADGAEWEQRWVAAFESGGHGIEVARRCVDVVDVLAVAAAGQGRAALLAADLRRLDGDAIDRLLAAGVAPVGVARRDDRAAHDRLRAAGVAHVLPDDADPAVVAAVLAEAVRDHADGSRGGAAGLATSDRAYADPAASMIVSPDTSHHDDVDVPARRGSVVAVWGPTGAPGRTTVAASLADEIARLGSSALLVDADVYGGTVAPALGLLDESPGLAAACRRAGAARVDAAELAALCWQLGPQLRVLTGIPLASRWPELRPAAVQAVLAAARTLAQFTVVDCGFGLETDEELSFDTLAPRRNGATLAVLDDADLVVAVGGADPIGMQRLVRGLAELGEIEVSAPVWVVLNRVRSGVLPGDAPRELTAALERFAGRTPAALLPLDIAGVDGALAAGKLLGEHAPHSPLRRALVELAAAVAGTPAPDTRRARRRRSG